jgi:glutamate dehydrogenase (NAD(P)+)
VDIACWALGATDTGPSKITPVDYKLPVEYKDGNPVPSNQYNAATNFTIRAAMPNDVELIITSEGDNGILFEGTKGRFFVNRGKITGKPVEEYGSRGREEATGRGVGTLAIKMLKRLNRKPELTRTAIQGFGNVGSHAAKYLYESAFPIVAVSDVSGAYVNPKGLNIPEMLSYVLKNKGLLAGYQGAERIDPDQLLALDVELLIPAALGDVITAKNVDQIKANLIIEGANGPIDPEADAKLNERNILVLPDILANAGGVTVSYFEWAQNRQHYKWTLDRVRQELDRTLSEAFESVWQESVSKKVSLRTSAFMLAIQRVKRASELAGWLV